MIWVIPVFLGIPYPVVTGGRSPGLGDLSVNVWVKSTPKILEKRPFFRSDMAGLGKYRMGGYGRIGV